MKRTATLDPSLLRDLRAAVSDLQTVNPWAGLIRFAILGCLSVSLIIFTWQQSAIWSFALSSLATGVVYAFWLICNHDANHRTLTGWQWFDTLMPRLVSWPVLWPVGTYHHLHPLHHAWNGIDLRDPERVQWTSTEYYHASPWQQWYVRHQWLMDILVLGGIGLIIRTVLHGLQLNTTYPHLRRQLTIDLVGILGSQALIMAIILLQGGELWKYGLFWIFLERGAGFINQSREHIEHYSTWQQVDGYQVTQLYACRNIQTYAWVNWLMGGLPYHSIHHAFPQIQSGKLPEAFDRIQAVLENYQLPPMTYENGYIASFLKHYNQFSLILDSREGPPVFKQAFG